jgi:hypothetical protein
VRVILGDGVKQGPPLGMRVTIEQEAIERRREITQNFIKMWGSH